MRNESASGASIIGVENLALKSSVQALFAALLLISLSGCHADHEKAMAATVVKPAKDRKPAPDFTLKDSYGQAVKLSDYKGKVVLLNFWATWCGPCKIEIPWFQEFETANTSKGFAVLGVAMDDEGWDVVKPYIEQHKVNYRVLLGNEQVGTLYGGVESLPTTFVLDREGKIASVHIGLVSKGDYAQEIQALLAGGKASVDGPGPVFAFLRPIR